MSARKRASKHGVHMMLVAGMSNDASGRWVRNDNATAAHKERAARNAARKVEHSGLRAARSSVLWAEALELARSEMVRRGDESDPLEWFVSKFYHELKRKKRSALR